MRRMRSSSSLLLVLTTAPLVAQPPLARVRDDPTRKVVGSGRLPGGWAVRFDPMPSAAPAPRASDVSVEEVGRALHVRSGPAAVYYRARDSVAGAYTVGATFSQPASMRHEAYGLVIGGRDLQTSTQRYVYFVVRPQDGGILVSRRSSDARPTALVPWTTDRAVRREDPRDGRATNQLAVRVGRDSVWFAVNGRVVRGLSRADLGGAPTDGAVGIRVNHNLDLRVDDFRVEPTTRR